MDETPVDYSRGAKDMPELSSDFVRISDNTAGANPRFRPGYSCNLSSVPNCPEIVVTLNHSQLNKRIQSAIRRPRSDAGVADFATALTEWRDLERARIDELKVENDRLRHELGLGRA